MQFRIPQSLDGFETAALASGLVSQHGLATAKASEDLSSLQPEPPVKLRRDSRQSLAWTKSRCTQVYSFLHRLDAEHGPTASQLQLFTRALNSAGTYAVEHLTNSAPHANEGSMELGYLSSESAISLSFFFTCHMLQCIEVSVCADP